MSGFASANVGKTPATESLALYETPVLYQTSDVSPATGYSQNVTESTVTKKWEIQSGSLPNDTSVHFIKNTAVSDWTTPIKARFWTDGDSSSTVDVTMSTSGNDTNGNPIYNASVPNETVNRVKFISNNSKSSRDLTLVNHGYGSTYSPALPKGLVLNLNTFKNNGADNDVSNVKAHYKDENGNHINNDPTGAHFSFNSDGLYGVWFTIPDDARYVKFYRTESNYSFDTDYLDLNNYHHGYGLYLKTNGNGNPPVEYGSVYHWSEFVSWSSTTDSWTDGEAGSLTSVAYTSTYQPEDRYGYISSINGTSDEDNFIYFDTSANTSYEPYVKFYTNNDGSGTTYEGVKTSDSSAANIKTDLAGTNLYRIRLPKNAKYFKIADGIDGTLSSSYIPLEEDVTITQGTGASAVDVSVENFRHAGTTFAVDSSGNASVQSLRSGFTPVKDTMADPLNPKTDADFVFFTDTNNTFANSGKVYAYFYGAADGEYMVSPTQSWPGIKASTDNEDLADTTYTDNAGNTVYMFRIPKGNEGTYSRVIFTNGLADDNANFKITQSQVISGGKNYVLDTTVSSQYYGAFATNGKVYAVDDTQANQKSTEPTADYNTGDGRTIYIINNGTPDIVSGSADSPAITRNPLDEMHIVFYSDAGTTPVGNENGYKPDKVIGEQYNGTDVYKINVPDYATYFKITNGIGKGTGSSDKERHSEVKQISDKGLYNFVEPDKVENNANSAASYVQGTYSSTLSNNAYLLDLVNPRIEPDDDPPPVNPSPGIHIATIVTDDTAGETLGKQKYIKWLRQVINPEYDPSEQNSEEYIVDREYLYHTNADIGPTAGTGGNGVKKVKVVKSSGTYTWKEVKAPEGYELVTETQTASGETTTFSDQPIIGKLKLVKEYADGMPSSLDNTEFTYTVTLTAPTGKKFTLSSGQIQVGNSDNSGTPVTITAEKFNSSTNVSGGAVTYTNASVTSDTTASFNVVVKKSEYVVVDNLPYNTQYSVREILPTDWLQENSSGQYGTTTTPSTGTIVSTTEKLVSFTNAKTTTLTVRKTIVLPESGLSSAEQTDLQNKTFTFTVTLSNADLALSDYTYSYTYSPTPTNSVPNISPAASEHPTTLTVILKGNQSATISGIPAGTQYQVVEGAPGLGWTTSYTLTDTPASGSASTTTGDTVSAPIRVIGENGSTAAFTNTYQKPELVDFTLEKSVVGSLPSSISDPYYKMTVTLKAPAGKNFLDYASVIEYDSSISDKTVRNC